MDCYAVLKVKFNATDLEIKNSYYALAKQYHPDQSSNVTDELQQLNKEKFQRVQSAYEILSNPDKKYNYDIAYAARFNKMAAVMMRGKGANFSQKDRENYTAESEWSYTYDSQGNKRRNYTETSAETPGDAKKAWKDAQRAGRSGSPGSRQRSQSQSYYNKGQGEARYSTASYGQHQYESGNDQLFKFGMGSFAMIVLMTGLVTDVMTRDTKGNQLTASSYQGLNQKGMVNSVANEFRVDAMRQVSQGSSSNYSPQISKKNYQDKDNIKMLLGNTEKQTGGTKSKDEF